MKTKTSQDNHGGGESLRLQDVENFFKYAINPGLIEAKIEKTTAAKMREQKGIPLPLIIALAIVLIAGAVAYNMINGTTKQNEYIGKYVECSRNLASKQTEQSSTSSKINLPPIAIGN